MNQREAIPDEAEIARRLTADDGHVPEAQIRVCRALMEYLRDNPAGLMPNLSKMAMTLGMKRQQVSRAFRKLLEKGVVTEGVQRVVAVPAVVKERRSIRVALPEENQLQLPLPPIVASRRLESIALS